MINFDCITKENNNDKKQNKKNPQIGQKFLIICIEY